MKGPKAWSSLAYFGIGVTFGAIVVYGLLLVFAPARWVQVLMVITVPSVIGMLAVLIREEIFWFLSP